MTNEYVASVTQFIDAVRALPRKDGDLVTFRGQRNAEWLVAPAILRPPAKLYPYEKQAVSDLLAIQPQEFQSDASMFDKLVRMQHFGLPTRLLDVTANPLVALYFAVQRAPTGGPGTNGRVAVFAAPPGRRKYFDSDTVSCLANLANLSADEKQAIAVTDPDMELKAFNELPAVDRLLQFVRMEKPYFRPYLQRNDLFRPAYVTPKMNNRRIVAQSGAFLLFGIDNDRDLIGQNPIRSDSIFVSQTAKATILAELDGLGINESTLFPEIDRAASYIARRYGG